MKDNPYKDMKDEQLEAERIRLDKEIQALRAKKKLIQDVLDARWQEPGPADHVIGGKNG